MIFLNLFQKKFSEKSPVLLLIYNRPETTKKVFAKIRDYRPTKLYIASDGPRVGNATDFEKCIKTKQIVEKIDWECEVFRLYRSENLGCSLAISSALNWIFQLEESAIILEDDCLPNITFFDFCTCLLNRYQNDLSVHHISGNNFQKGLIRGNGSYYFSNYPHIWGWATWRRAWRFFDLNFHGDDSCRRNHVVNSVLKSQEECSFWIHWMERVLAGEVNTWDIARCYSMWRAQGTAILPNKNLVSNIGFTGEGTHTTSSTWYSNLPAEPMRKIIHPSSQAIDHLADEYSFKNLFSGSF